MIYKGQYLSHVCEWTNRSSPKYNRHLSQNIIEICPKINYFSSSKRRSDHWSILSHPNIPKLGGACQRTMDKRYTMEFFLLLNFPVSGWWLLYTSNGWWEGLSAALDDVDIRPGRRLVIDGDGLFPSQDPCSLPSCCIISPTHPNASHRAANAIQCNDFQCN